MDNAFIFVGGLVILTIIFIAKGVRLVPQSEEWVVERFGKYTHTMTPGLHVIIPFIDRVGARISMRETVFDVPSQDVITRDNAMVRVDGVVFYQVLDAAKAAYEVANLEKAIMNLTMTNIRTVMGSMDLDELLSHREQINSSLLRVVDDATTPWGVKVTRVEIRDIHPPKDLVDSMARQMKAEREKRAAILEAEGERQALILKAEGTKQAAILESEGQKQAVILKAEAEKEAAFRAAEGRERTAEAEARATATISQALTQGSIQVINYFVAEKYMAVLKHLASADNQKIMLLPLEATNVLGALAGVTEIAREAFKEQAIKREQTMKPTQRES
jgi:regulator of protease activity HflC (stomatin/prohibitin superfamily)